MEIAVGNAIMLEIVKKNNSGIIVPDSVEQDVNYIIRGLGTNIDEALGLEVGQEIIVRSGARGQTLDSGLVVLPASSVLAIIKRSDKE